jgi:Late exocytosis, associated with Golgi transport/Cytosolic domain of 10TM putative phosphate transporter
LALYDDKDVLSTVSLFAKFTQNRNITLSKPVDVPVDAVVTSIYFNSVVFILLMIFYECLRRIFPSVYSARQRLNHIRPVKMNRKEANPLMSPNQVDNDDEPIFEHDRGIPHGIRRNSDISIEAVEEKLSFGSMSSLPDERPLDWLRPVLEVPWSKVLETAGLDGYFFLRYIRMCVRITAVSSFWFCLVLIPIYTTGNNSSESATGLYYISTEHIPTTGWRMWVACIFAYLFSFFIFFVIQQEYRHFLEVTQDFLCKGSIHVNPQNQYSILVERIPYELRSDRALAEYFNTLFPGKVHSASVVLKLPDLEKISNRCLFSCRRLEKSIAALIATRKRPTSFVRTCRMGFLGTDLLPIVCPVSTLQCCDVGESDEIDDSNEFRQSIETLTGRKMETSKRWTRVDLIAYYTQELALHSRSLFRMQQQKTVIAESGNQTIQCNNWFDYAIREASLFANQILDESAKGNALVTSRDDDVTVGIAERMSSQYGTINQAVLLDCNNQSELNNIQNGRETESREITPLLRNETENMENGVSLPCLSILCRFFFLYSVLFSSTN